MDPSTAHAKFGWWRITRLVLCLLAAATWLLIALAVTRVAYARGGDIDQCVFEGNEIGVEDNWPWPPFTCIFEQPDGSIVKERRYIMPLVILATGAVIGLGPAGVLLWIGFGRPRVLRRGTPRQSNSAPRG